MATGNSFLYFTIFKDVTYVTKNIEVVNKTQHADTSLLVYVKEGQNRTFSNVNSLHGLESEANISV